MTRGTVGSETLWFVEAHLGDDVQVETIADALGVSRFHVSRAFLAEIGEPLSSYVRARRLSEAAKRLAGGAADILAVALGVGYGSHEAFTRAFSRQFGVTPEQVRSRASTDGLALREPHAFAWTSEGGGPSMKATKPKRTRHDAMTIAGVVRTYDCTTPEGRAGIPNQWADVAAHFGGIDGEVPGAAYGIVLDGTDDGTIRYVVGVEVKGTAALPAGFERFTIPAQDYAEWQHHGHVAGIQETLAAIWGHALRDAGLRASGGPVIERYGDDFDARTGHGTVGIWVPVVAA
jgi:AraC family transcriptional regulator